MLNLKVISGGQTGADIAGLWAAKIFGLPTGGLAPKDWKTQVGSKPELGHLFGLEEYTAGYKGRTKKNCESSNLTMIFASNINSPGTKLTLHHCVTKGVHYQVYSYGNQDVTGWVDPIVTRITTAFKNAGLLLPNNHELVVNVAGNSTSSSPLAFTFTFYALCGAFEKMLGFTPQILKDHGIRELETMLRDRYDL